MPFQSMQQIAGLCIPNFTRAIIGARDKLIAIFIEPTVGQWQNMRFQSFKQFEILLFLLLYL